MSISISSAPANSYAAPRMEWLFSISPSQTSLEPSHVGVLTYPSFKLVSEVRYAEGKPVRALVRFRCFDCNAATQLLQRGVTSCVGCYRAYPTLRGRPGAVLASPRRDVEEDRAHLESWLIHDVGVLEASLIASDLFSVPWAPPQVELQSFGGYGLGDTIIDEYLGVP